MATQVGYARVSTLDQNLDGQTEQLRLAGAERIYSEYASGSYDERPELAACLKRHFPVMDEPSWREPDPEHDQAADLHGDSGPDLQRPGQGHGEGHEDQHGQAAERAGHRGGDAVDHAAAVHDRQDRALHGAAAEGIPEVAGAQPAQEFRIGQRVRRDGFPTDAGADQGRGTGHTRPASRSRDADRQRGRDRGR